MLMVQKYSLEAARQSMPEMNDLSKEERERTLFYLGIASYINLMTQAQDEGEEKQVIINELLLDEIDTELLIQHQKLKTLG